MGYVLVTGSCICCKRVICFSPTKVPSLPINGQREPICRECIVAANVVRKEKGLTEIRILPGAYDADDENEVPWPQD